MKKGRTVSTAEGIQNFSVCTMNLERKHILNVVGIMRKSRLVNVRLTQCWKMNLIGREKYVSRRWKNWKSFAVKSILPN